MKIISCHIENYGKLVGADYSFNGNLTVFNEENGAGKTTLASFIKAMFYGLASYTKSTKAFCDRQRYYPFNGGKFGGNLTFEKGGDTYRIERFFDKKSETKDELNLYKNGMPVKCAGNPGEEIFGIDENSFARTAFITAEDIDGGTSSDIGEKITGKVFNSEGVGLNKALDALTDKSRELLAGRGNGGEINRNRDLKRRLTDEIKGLEDTDRALTAKYGESNSLTCEIKELEKRLEKLNEDKIVAEKWAVYDGYTEELNSKKAELDDLSTRYKKGLPSIDEIRQAEEKYSVYSKNSGALEGTQFLKEERLKELGKRFSFGVPSDEDFEKCACLLDSASRLSAEAEQLSSAQGGAKEEKLLDTFRHGLPKESELEKAETASERYRANDLKLKTPALAQTAPKKNNIPFIIGLGVFALLLVAGIVLLLFSIKIAGIVLLSAGGAGVVACAVLLILRKNGNAPVQINGDIVSELSADEQIIRNFLAPYGYYSDSVISSFTQFLSDLEEYKTLVSEREEKRGLTEEKSNKAKEREEEVFALLKKYGYENVSARAGLDELKKDASEYTLLSSQKQSAEQNRNKFTSENRQILEFITALFGKYGLTFTGAENLRTLSDDIKNYERLQREVKEKEARALSYKSENGLLERVEEKVEDLTEVKESLTEKRKALGLLDSQISEDEANLELLPQKTAQVEELEILIERDLRKVEILSAAKEMLLSAHTGLCDKYVAPVKDSFKKYSDGILKALGEKMSMRPDFEVDFEFGGEIKSRKHLSAGQLAVCGLCLRLALIEHIFKTEKPFVIMDDPFINLDLENMQKTAKAVKEFGKDVQIIYFCCHDSRKI